MMPRLLQAMGNIVQKQKRCIEEGLLSLRPGNAVLVILSGIAGVPVESNDEVDPGVRTDLKVV